MLDPSAFTPPYDHHLCRGLSTVGCDLTLYTTRSDYHLWDGERAYDWIEYFYRATNTLYSDRDGLPGRTAVKGIEHVIDMTRFIRKAWSLDPDVIHIQWTPVPVVDQWFLQALARVAPLVFTVHNTTPFHGASTSRIQLLGADTIHETADHLIVHTETSRDELINRGIPATKISVVPHGILEYPSATAADGKADADNQTILFFGTIKPYKNIDTLLEAYAALPAETRDTTDLHIAGYPKMDAKLLQRWARDLGIESSVRWDLRFVPDSEVSALFDTADVIAFPYDDVDQSGALLTALQYETPIVATDIAGFAEVLTDGEHGFLVPPNDAVALADALDNVLADPELLACMRENISDLAESIPSWTEIAAKTQDVYRSVT
ncbi:glycosyltransferase family 4 protein [Natrinema hispanicum]|nr:glycosyltransferase family 4 protein [Natrinema hispanicum]